MGLAVGLALTAAGASPVAVGAATTTTTASTPATAQLRAALAAARAEPSVHFTTSTTLGARNYTVVGDAGHKLGVQTVTVTNGTKTGHVKVRLVHSDFYIEGDTYGLTTYVGMPSNLATEYKNRWIAFGPSTPDFSAIEKSMTVTAAIGQISLDGPLTMTTSTVAGAPVVVLSGTTTSLSSKGHTGPATLVVAGNGSNLPVSFTGQGKDGTSVARGSIAYSDWGEKLTVTRPANPVPSSKV